MDARVTKKTVTCGGRRGRALHQKAMGGTLHWGLFSMPRRCDFLDGVMKETVPTPHLQSHMTRKRKRQQTEMKSCGDLVFRVKTHLNC